LGRFNVPDLHVVASTFHATPANSTAAVIPRAIANFRMSRSPSIAFVEAFRRSRRIARFASGTLVEDVTNSQLRVFTSVEALREQLWRSCRHVRRQRRKYRARSPEAA